MSVGSTVYCDVNGQRQEYKLATLLGTGAIGGVYLGVSATNGMQIAVKIPHERLPADLELRFWQELTVLNKLEGPAGGRFFPRAWRGTLADSGRPVMCMDLVHGRRLVDLITEREGDPDKRERLALDAALQYAQMIGVLHAAQISCPDRKLNDVYWDEALERLTVLDWNVVDQGEQIKGGQDLYIFGALWYELLTGSLPSPVEERVRRPLEKHPAWEKLSYGTQATLRRVLSPDLERRYPSAEALASDLDQHRQDFGAEPGKLVRKAEHWLSQAQAALSAGQAALYRAEAARRYDDERDATESLARSKEQITVLQSSRDAALRLADLARRRGVPGTERLWNDAQDLRRGLLELIALASQRVRMVQYTAATQWLEVVEKAAADEPATLLNLERWRTLAEAGRAAIDANLSLKQHLEPLTEMVGALEAKQVGKADDIWKRLQPRLDATGWRKELPSRSLLASLGHEAAFGQAWDAAQQEEDRRQFAPAAKHLRNALQQVEQIAYARRLLTSLGHTPDSLRGKAAELEDRAQIEGRVQDRLKAGNKLLEIGDYDAARGELRAGLALLGGELILQAERAQLQRALLLADWLPKLDRARTGQAWDSLFALLTLLAQADAREPFVAARVKQGVQAALETLPISTSAWGSEIVPKTYRECVHAERILTGFKTLDDNQRRNWLYPIMGWRTW